MSFVSDLLWKLLPWKLRDAECAHFEQAVHTDADNVEGCGGMPQNRGRVCTPAALHGLRSCRLLRQLA
jgi:hypothetical protein